MLERLIVDVYRRSLWRLPTRYTAGSWGALRARVRRTRDCAAAPVTPNG